MKQVILSSFFFPVNVGDRTGQVGRSAELGAVRGRRMERALERCDARNTRAMVKEGGGGVRVGQK